MQQTRGRGVHPDMLNRQHKSTSSSPPPPPPFPGVVLQQASGQFCVHSIGSNGHGCQEMTIFHSFLICCRANASVPACRTGCLAPRGRCCTPAWALPAGLCSSQVSWLGGLEAVGVSTQKGHPAKPSTIQSCDSPKLGTCAWCAQQK